MPPQEDLACKSTPDYAHDFVHESGLASHKQIGYQKEKEKGTEKSWEENTYIFVGHQMRQMDESQFIIGLTVVTGPASIHPCIYLSVYVCTLWRPTEDI